MRFFLTRHNTGRAAAAALAGAALAGCNADKLTTVATPDFALPGSVNTVSALPNVFNTATGEMAVAFAGGYGTTGTNTGFSGTEGQILYSGLLGDEILLSDTFPTRREIDYRNIQLTNSSNDPVYRQLQVARQAAERSASAYVTLKQAANPQQAEAYALAGFAYTMLAENYCGGVPFTSINADGTTNPAPANTTVQILARASAKFDSAIATANAANAATVNSASTQLALANIGKARVLLDQGQYAAAAQQVAGVQTKYAYQLTYSTNTSRQNNGVWGYSVSGRRFSVANSEGTNGLNYRSANDPRVLWNAGNGVTGRGFDNSSLFIPIKYSEQTAPATLASGVEARLIEAEAAMNANNYAGALNTLNALRRDSTNYVCPTTVTIPNYTCAAPAKLPDLTDPGSQTGRVQQLFRERAFWLFLTSHRLGDMRRLVRSSNASGLSAYGFAVNSVYPIGAYVPQTGVNYGSNVALPVPFSEQTSNPLYNPAACDPNAP